MTTILLIRHGENDFLGKYLPGHLAFIHLNEAGKAQAFLVADSLKNIPITSIVSSPLERAVETAEPLAKMLGLTIDLEPGFIEMNTGAWTGKNFPEIKKDPLWEKLRSDPENYGFPEGEGFGAAQQRLWATLQQVVEKQPEHAIVAIFSHSDCIKLMLTSAMDVPLKRYYSFGVDTASMSVLVFRKNRIYLDGQNLRLPYQWKPSVKPIPIQNQIAD